MENKFEPLENGEVLSVDPAAQLLIGHRTFKAGELAEALRAQLEYGLGGAGGWSQAKDGWFAEDGIDCEVLRFGDRDWQKGKVRIRLEFSPLNPSAVEAPSPLVNAAKPAEEAPVALPTAASQPADKEIDSVILGDIWEEIG